MLSKKHGIRTDLNNPRDKIIHSINKQGQKNWRKQSGYHRRSLAETAMFRIKTLFGDRLHARLLNTQVTEALIRCKALNKMSALGMRYSID